MNNRPQFESHWQRLSAPAIAPSKIEEARTFLAPIAAASPRGRVLDVGCGDGVHAAAFQKAELRGWQYHGIDLSFTGVSVARSRFDGEAARMAVADARRLPFAPGSFDAVFSYGVLAYTGEPRGVLDEMIRVARRGALIGVWLYPRRAGLAGAAFTGLRRLCRVLGPRGSRPIVWSIVLLLPWLPVQSGVNLRTASWRQCVEIVEVNLLPPVLEFFEAADVERWCRESGLEIVLVDRRRPVTVWARRSA